MKKLTALTLATLLVATPAFAGTWNYQDAQNYDANYYSGNYTQVFGNNASVNSGVANIGVNGSKGIINQNVNDGVISNTGSSTDVVLSGGYSSRGGNTDIGGFNNQNAPVSTAVLVQVATNTAVDVGSVHSTFVAGSNGGWNGGISNVGVYNASGIINQNVNTGWVANAGSAVGVSIR